VKQENMNVESEISTEHAMAPQIRVAAGLDVAAGLQRSGHPGEAAAELEKALATARATPYEIEFQTRIRLSMTLADIYLSIDQIQTARAMLTAEVAFAKKISELMQATGTPGQRRSATSGYLQVRDRLTQLELIGQTAPDFSITSWIKGEPATLAAQRGQVVLLEFWATWCKPCREMFPKLKWLYEQQSARGLAIIAITRHYMAYGGPEESKTEELALMRAMLEECGVNFPVGVAEDERLQSIYGANGLPTVVLIDRQGVARYAGPGGEDPSFTEMLERCLAQSA
jgi:thiol-disulfide isomerase/thioredoxin